MTKGCVIIHSVLLCFWLVDLHYSVEHSHQMRGASLIYIAVHLPVALFLGDCKVVEVVGAGGDLLELRRTQPLVVPIVEKGYVLFIWRQMHSIIISIVPH